MRPISLFLIAYASPYVLAQYDILAGTYFRFGNGFENSVQPTGALGQPFTTIAGAFKKLTYGTYPMDTVLEVDGVKLPVDSLGGPGGNVAPPTANIIYNDYTKTGDGTTGKGTITVDQWYTSVTANTPLGAGNDGIIGQIVPNLRAGNRRFRFRRSYTMATSNSRAITVQFEIIPEFDSDVYQNVKVWFGTRDDYIGNSDSPTKTVGSITGGVFVPAAGTTGSAVQVTTATEGVILYTLQDGGVANVNSCCSFSNVVNMSPTHTYSAPIGPADGSYGVYLPLGRNDWHPQLGDRKLCEHENYGGWGWGRNCVASVIYAAGALSELTSVTASANAVATGVPEPDPVPVAANGDPHLTLPHGGRADFRGEDKALYNFLSAKGFSLNVMTELADFELHAPEHPKHKHVHGSFLTQAHVIAKTLTGKTVRVSYFAAAVGPTNRAFVNGTVEDMTFKLGAHSEKTVDDVAITISYSSLTVTTPEFEVVVTPMNLRQEEWGRDPFMVNVVGLHHRLDVQMKLRVPEAQLSVAPHGIIGQGYDGDGKAIDGEVDTFPASGEFTTSAMAKGAIEGTPNDYKVASKYATDFKYSRFDKDSAPPRDVAALVASGGLNSPKAVAGQTGGFVGATEYNETTYMVEL
jgi:hypothetical protein